MSTETSACDNDTTARRGGIVRSIGQVVAVAHDVRQLVAVLCHGLGWRSVWRAPAGDDTAPLAVWLGDLPLEVSFVRNASAPLALTAISFVSEPLVESVDELDRRGIPSQMWPARPGCRGLRLPGFIGDNADVFLAEHRGQTAAHPNGGVLGVKAVAEVIVGAKDLKVEQRRWQRLVDPIRPAEKGVWRFGEGPCLRLVADRRDGVLGLKLRVESLDAARKRLEERDLLGSITGDGVGVDRDGLLGLDVLLVD